MGALLNSSSADRQIEGFGRFRGLSVTSTGEIKFSFDPQNEGQLPFIVPEDIEVALALAFGDNRAIWPSFSAEPPAEVTPTSPDWIPFTAQWSPQWLGHTALGNTLFATDCEAGPLVLWRITKAEIAEGDGIDGSLSKLRHVIDTMKAVEAHDGGYKDFLTFRVAAVEFGWKKSPDGSLACSAVNTVVGLRTGTIDENDTRTYTDNKDFATGYRAAICNANYDLFAKHYPLLERYRQLATLVSALNQLREKGFEPAEPIRKAIDASYQSFLSRPAPLQTSQLFY